MANNSDNYDILDKLGSGTYGAVHKGLNRRTNQTVAIKVIQSSLEEGVTPTTIREVCLLKALHHPNIIPLYEVYISQQQLHLVFQYMQFDLERYMKHHKYQEGLPSEECKKFMWELVNGVDYLHERRIIHRDLKPQNLLIDSDGTLKIADFGLARPYGLPLNEYSTHVATQWYRAPDVLLGSTKYTTSIDTWALGCIMAEMYTGKPLFPGSTEEDQLGLIFQMFGTPNERTWPGVSKLPKFRYDFPQYNYQPFQIPNLFLDNNGQDLCQRMLLYDPTKRFNTKKILTHPYFKEFRYNQLGIDRHSYFEYQ
ncbi:negative regulator of the PHO system [Conidiobolus coronatus NRRL 28638]|jgi:serine/threonine protein kinase|uniref:Negative regulator of the PHO system n=1 Tax=Conidiobolus coronatus (strain ATCC 28846 / CBS 209.66 / NRRL 28638) TaxID=796925 RepID=A0A137PAG6_CONC2|nr:negative regulator of the PHO system [Conidiobolus coronatus NRRL 28638]|eukprot:KXN72003.1 negative regulator of the PHO system [Conidiobolus coronatus NRRL 28638]